LSNKLLWQNEPAYYRVPTLLLTKNPGLFQDPHQKFSQDLFGAHKCLNRKKKTLRAESRVGLLGKGQCSEHLLHQLEGLGKRCKLPQCGAGQSPGKFENWCNLRHQNSLQKCL